MRYVPLNRRLLVKVFDENAEGADGEPLVLVPQKKDQDIDEDANPIYQVLDVAEDVKLKVEEGQCITVEPGTIVKEEIVYRGKKHTFLLALENYVKGVIIWR